MYDDVHVGYKLEILLFLVAKPHAVAFIAHLRNIPQDHDPMFTVASMFKQMQDLCVSFAVYIPGPRGWQHTISLHEISKSRDFNCDFVISTVIS